MAVSVNVAKLQSSVISSETPIRKIKGQVELVRKMKNEAQDKNSPAILEEVFKLLTYKMNHREMRAKEILTSTYAPGELINREMVKINSNCMVKLSYSKISL